MRGFRSRGSRRGAAQEKAPDAAAPAAGGLNAVAATERATGWGAGTPKNNPQLGSLRAVRRALRSPNCGLFFGVPARRPGRRDTPAGGPPSPPDDAEPEDAKEAVGDLQGEILPAAVQEFVERRLVHPRLL